MIRACVFDMDGVIVDTEGLHMESFRRLLRENLVAFDEDFVQSLVGYSIRNNIKEIKRRLFAEAEFDIEAGIKRRNAIYLDLVSTQDLAPLPGVLDLIAHCRRKGIRLALASSSDRQQVTVIMQKVLKDYFRWFEVVVTGDDVARKKPFPDIYVHAVKKLNLPPASCLALEDSPPGVESAMAAGLVCFAVRNYYTDDKLLSKADKVIGSVYEVIDHLLGN